MALNHKINRNQTDKQTIKLSYNVLALCYLSATALFFYWVGKRIAKKRAKGEPTPAPLKPKKEKLNDSDPSDEQIEEMLIIEMLLNNAIQKYNLQFDKLYLVKCNGIAMIGVDSGKLTFSKEPYKICDSNPVDGE